MIVALLVTALLTAITSGMPGASTAALSDVPASYLSLYQQAAADCPGLDWTLLAAIGKVESDHGRSTAPGVSHGENTAGAGGPMQFLQPTFAAVIARHQLPPGGATPPSRYDPQDAVHAAADFLCDHHATTDPARAVFAYNHADTYVAAVLTQAAAYRQPAPTRTGWPAQAATVPDPSGTGGHVTPRTATLYRALTTHHAVREGASCWDPHRQNPDSDHPRGRACDVFLHPHDPADIAQGWSIARWLIAHQADYGLHYLIWQGLIWTSEQPHWTAYRSTRYGCPDPKNLTGCHYDHIHISLY
jgi:hypothetical protein